ncbi:MAG: hypothetical protein O2830_06485 [Verrucomicrobia bacterium]|jgi:hypothetical protein|nr:hypothetical protein [Verrucomicrobiota bacterium]
MPLADPQRLLLLALQEYLKAVTAQKAPNPPDLFPHCIALEQLESKFSSQLDPRLAHFLESKSYRKAHDYLASLPTSALANAKDSAQSCSR